MIRPTIASDILDLAPRLREADVEEVHALAGVDPLAALAVGLFQSSSCMTGVGRDGSIVGVFGVVPLPDGDASVWFLSSPEIVQNTREIIVEGRKWLDEQNALYPVLKNVCSKSNVVHLRLIRCLGFTFLEPMEDVGPGGITVIPFERTRNV